MKFINMTPHNISIMLENGMIRTIKTSGQVARLDATFEKLGVYKGIPILQRKMGRVENLPSEKLGVNAYIVSSMILSALPARADLYAPDTGATAIRKDGRIIAVRNLIRGDSK